MKPDSGVNLLIRVIDRQVIRGLSPGVMSPMRNEGYSPRMLLRITAVVAVVVLAGCSSGGSATEDDLTIADGDSVEVHYVLTLDDGSQVDASRDRGQTLTFVVGSGEVIPGFDTAVIGAKAGDVVDATVQPEDGYGQPNPDLVIELPIADGQDDVAVGDKVFLSNGQPAIVLAVGDGVATVDTNHELAGEVLHFEIEIVGITRGT